MKSLILIIAMVASIGTAKAQLNVSDAQYYSENYLVNPSFEQGKKGWFLADGTWTTSTIGAQVAHLKSAAAISISAETLDFRQTITVPAGAASLPGKVSVSIKTTVTELAFCVEVNNVTAECTLVNSDGNYHNYILNVEALGATNTILKIISFSAKTGDIYVDDAKIAVRKDFNVDDQDENGELISNSGFEKNVFTNVSCTNATIEHVDAVAGGKNNLYALEITATGTPWSCDIDGTGGQGTGFAVLQSVATVGADAEFCILANGVEQACHESNILTTKSETFTIPTALDATENSIRIKGTSASNVVTVDKASIKAGQLTTTGYYREQLLNLTGSGNFTGGTLKIVSDGQSATLSIVSQATHATSAAPNSATGAIPVWARPDSTKGTVYSFGSTNTAYWFFVQPDGTFGFRYYTNATTQSRTVSDTTPTISYALPEAQTVQSFNSVVYGSQLIATSSTAQSVSTEATIQFSSSDVKNATFASDQLTIEQSGWYEITFDSQLTRVATNSSNIQVDAFIRINSTNFGTCRRIVRYQDTSLSTSAGSVQFSSINCPHISYLSKGDVVSVRGLAAADVNFGSRTLIVKRIMNPNGEPLSGVFEGYPQARGEKKRIIYGYASFGQATDGSECSSSPCVRYRDFGDIGRNISVTRSGLGDYNVTASGFAPNAPLFCSVSGSSGAAIRDCSPSNSNFLSNSSGVATFNVLCFVKTGSVAADNYLTIKCEGEAP
jgi:hypothetical protein